MSPGTADRARGSHPLGRAELALAASVVLLLVPLAARAGDAAQPAHAQTYRFATGTALVVVVSAIVTVAFLMNRFAAKKRRHLRTSAIAGLLYVLAFATQQILAFFGVGGVALVGEMAEFFGLVAVVNLSALVVFDVGLSALGVGFAPFLAGLMEIIGNVAAVVITLRRNGVDFSGILATSVLLTTVTAFSLQGTLSNVVGGLALQIDDSIRVGDWVQLENGRQGKVREIRWRYTVIETRDWDTLVVPNATILSSTLAILGKREGQPLQHRMWVYFNVDFRWSPADVIDAVNKGLQAAPIEGVAADPKPHAICVDLAKADSFAYYAVRYWLTDLARDDPTSSRVRERVFTALRREGISLAIPGARVWVDQDADNRERRARRESARRLAALATLELLRGLRDDERAHVAEGLKYALFAPGETITKQGAVAHWLYIVVTGSAEVRVDVDGKDKVVATIHAPDFVGEMGLMTGAPRSATVVALTEVECYRLDKATFNTIIRERPEVVHEMSSVLANRKVGLQATREDLDAEARQRALEAEHRRMLRAVQRFFGLDDDAPPPPSTAR